MLYTFAFCVKWVGASGTAPPDVQRGAQRGGMCLLYLPPRGFILGVMNSATATIAVYILVVFLALFAIKRGNARLYAASKPLLMPFLYLCYAKLLPASLAGLPYQRYVLLALLMHTAGDVFLLFPRGKSKHMFYLGMLSFFAGHIFYTLWFANAPVGHTKRWTVTTIIVCLLVEYLIYRQLMLGPRKDAPKLVPYSMGLCAVAVSIASTAGNGSPLYATAVSFAGICLFFFSDFCIMRRMVRLPLFGQFTVMSTYILGQTLIVTGMLLMQMPYV